jgi:hypothetical protein
MDVQLARRLASDGVRTVRDHHLGRVTDDAVTPSSRRVVIEECRRTYL